MLKPQRDGKLRECWYGVYTDTDGKRKVINLDVKWAGTPPTSGKVSDLGDIAFERSRFKAGEALAVYTEDAKRKGRAEHLTERLIESKTGRAVEYTRLTDLPMRWRNLGRESTPTERHLNSCDNHLRRFITFMKERNPSAEYLYEVTEADAAAYVSKCRISLAPATAKATVHLIRQAMARFLPVGASNPFSSIVSRRANGDRGVIHRKPFTPEELRALLDAAKSDTFLYPLVVCAAMTGMRLGDVCNLKWSSVDLESGMIAVKTSKTEKEVEIPIFAPLRAVLVELGGKGRGNVFPAAAILHKRNPDSLTWRFKKIIVLALSNELPTSITNRVPASEILDEGLELIHAKVPAGKRRDRMITVLKRYAAGRSFKQIETETGYRRSAVSNDLNTIECWLGKSFVRGNTPGYHVVDAIAKLTNAKRNLGQRAGSVRDWHALRSTFVTLALGAGVPIELVKRITGHATVDVILSHYFRPDREAFRASLTNAMPEVLTGSKPKKLLAADELATLVEKAQAGTATEDEKNQIRLLAAKI